MLQQTREAARLHQRSILYTSQGHESGDDLLSPELQQLRDEKQKAKAELQRHFNLLVDPNAEVLVFLVRILD